MPEATACGLAILDARLVLAFTGNDRVRYLNGQITADLATAKVPSVSPACVTTAKGRLCGDVMVTILEDQVLVDADPALAETLPARFEKYIVADDVQLEVVTTALLLHVIGVSAEELNEFSGLQFLPANRFGTKGFDLWIPLADFEKVIAGLHARFSILTTDHLESLRISNGVPRWGFDLDEKTLPPEAGLHRTHISYSKGCYVGQEVISRLKSVGHVNRELVRITAPEGSGIHRGDTLRTVDQPDVVIGQITSVAPGFGLDTVAALGYVKCGCSNGNLLALGIDPGAKPVEVHPSSIS